MINLNKIPDHPGAYLMKDKSGTVIYVGKALSLRKRVRSYFSDISRHRTHALVSHVDTIDYIITDSEQEALLLEANLIKLHLPRYNINLKDDKKYPYIKITLKEDFPTVISTRDLSDRNAVYFGPYTNAKNMRRALRTATRVFPVRICRRMPKRVCALFYMGRCSAPCEGKIDKDNYRKLIQEMIDFLSGKGNKIEKRLKKELEIYKDNLEFEKAIIIRNRLKALEDIKRKQRIVLKTDKNIDVFGLSRKKRTAIVAVIKIRNGRMIGIEHYALNAGSGDSDESIIDTFFVQYYKDTFYIPDEVILPRIGEQMLLENWIRNRAKRKIKIKVPKKGIRFSLIKLAEENALIHIEEESSERIPYSLIELAKYLHLEKPPGLIEAYDISNISGEYMVGSKVAFMEGRKYKSLYRRFRIRDVYGIDDPKAIEEIVERRFKSKNKTPDLIIIDGGITQVRSAHKAIERTTKISIPLFGLAKRFEELYTIEGKIVSIPKSSSALRLLQRIRNEAHRFAIEYHRKLRDRTGSILDEIDGIGEKRRILLLKHFGSVERLKKASLEEIKSISGIGKKYAERIHKFLREIQT